MIRTGSTAAGRNDRPTALVVALLYAGGVGLRLIAPMLL
jgi:hypothetical protein